MKKKLMSYAELKEAMKVPLVRETANQVSQFIVKRFGSLPDNGFSIKLRKSMSTTIEGGGVFPVDVKRFYIPFTVKAKCPECGEEVVRSCEDHYLSYPDANEPFDLHMVCYKEWQKEDGEWDSHECEFSVRVVLKVTLELVNGEAAQGAEEGQEHQVPEA